MKLSPEVNLLAVAHYLQALEVLRTIHSFDPCIACAIHLTDQENNTAIYVRAV